MNTSVSTEFCDQSIFRLRENTEKVRKCLEELTEEELWKRPNGSSNSVGNLVLHLCGNITQYILSALGATEDTRQRDEEFSTQGGLTKKELFEKLLTTVEKSVDTIRTINPDELLKQRSVQGYTYSGIGIILHVVEHYSYHTGQIIFWVKLLKDKDLGFYANVDLNKKNRI